MLYARNIRSRAHLRRTLAGVQRAARHSPIRLPLLLLLDQEGGLVQRLPGGQTWLAARVGSTRGAYRTGLQAGTTLRRVNINVNLAPVADVCRPTLGARARAALLQPPAVGGARPHPGIRRRTAPPRGAPGGQALPGPRRGAHEHRQRPGHDPGLALDASAHRRAPVRGAGTDGHAQHRVYPAFDRHRVAALSRAVIVGDLRRRMRFRGVTISDAFDTPTGFGLAGPARIALADRRPGRPRPDPVRAHLRELGHRRADDRVGDPREPAPAHCRPAVGRPRAGAAPPGGPPGLRRRPPLLIESEVADAVTVALRIVLVLMVVAAGVEMVVTGPSEGARLPGAKRCPVFPRPATGTGGWTSSGSTAAPRRS